MYSPLEVDRIWLWVYFNKTPIYQAFYLLYGESKERMGLHEVFC